MQPPPSSRTTPDPDTIPSERTLRHGCRGEDVRRLQLLLDTRSFVVSQLVPDGVFGPKTLSAVTRSRAALGLPFSEEADSALLERLRRLPPAHVEVPRVRTPVSMKERRRALAEGYRRVFEKDAESELLRMGLAHLQTEHGGNAIWVNNFGNVMAEHGEPYFVMEAEEEIGGERVLRRSVWFAAAEPPEGAAKYFERLRDKWPDALALMTARAPQAFARALKLQRDANGRPRPYYTAKLEDYQRLLNDCWRGLQ